MLAAAKSKKLAANLAAFGIMCIALGASMILMAIALKIIGTLDKSELAKGAAFLGEFITFIGLLALVTRKASTTVKEFAAIMIQRFWRSKKAADKKARKAAKLSFNKIFIGRPTNAFAKDEREVRLGLVEAIIESSP